LYGLLFLLLGCARSTQPTNETPVGQALTMNGFSWVFEDSLAGMPQPGAKSSVEDDLAFMQQQGVDVIISANERGVDEKLAATYGIDVISLPIEDFHPPTMKQMHTFVATTEQRLDADEKVAVHCTAGMGRTGTYLAVWFVSRGMTAQQAIDHVREKRPGSIETESQEAAIGEYCVDAGHCPSADPAHEDCPNWAPTLVGSFQLIHYPGMKDVGPNGEDPMPMSKDYEFGAKTYTMSGYPPLEVSGSYKVLDREPKRLNIRFFDTIFDGSPQAEHTVWASFSSCGDQLEMDGMTYRRSEKVGPSKEQGE
jgi:atypical dual specificity phosphatase